MGQLRRRGCLFATWFEFHATPGKGVETDWLEVPPPQ